MSQINFQITRDQRGDAGYTIALVSIGDMDFLLIANVKSSGPAANAGMTKEHVGWAIVSINNSSPSNLNELNNLLNLTKKPNCTFTLGLRLIFEKNSQNDTLIKSKLKIENSSYNSYQMTTGDMFSLMWTELVKECPKYENIEDNNFRHAMLACSSHEALERCYNQYLDSLQ